MAIDRKILSIDSDDEGIDVKTFSKYLQDDTLRQKNKVANEFTEIGEDLLAEIEDKKLRQEQQKEKQIKYILGRTKNEYSSCILKTYSFDDVRNIYNDVRNNRNIFRKIFHFIFNL